MNSLENQATLAFLLSAAARELFPQRMLFIEHSLADGYYCHMGKGDPLSLRDVARLANRMRSYLSSRTDIVLSEVPRRELARLFSRERRQDKLAILDTWKVDPVPCIRFGNFLDYRFEPMTVDKAALQGFELRPYDVGFVLRFPALGTSNHRGSFVDAPKLYQIIKEHERWGDILGVSNIGELNRLVKTGEIREMIWVAEGLHEKKISQIADGLCQEFPEKRLVFIAGPSASGKTTFSKRLGIQLKVNGLSSVSISLDDYYLDRDKIPADEWGQQDLESILALDTDLLCKHIDQLLGGYAVRERKFDFSSGRGSATGKMIALAEHSFLIFEGIHGLNPICAEGIGEERIQRIYVSALTQLNVDREHRVSTADNRLLRRMVRDRKYRSYSVGETLSHWSTVRAGEEKNIFPFQEQADFMFNSYLVYEIPVLAGKVIPLLDGVSKKSAGHEIAHRLLVFLSFFEQIRSEHIPETSILREFIGGSAFVG